jgi:hypothetical protein
MFSPRQNAEQPADSSPSDFAHDGARASSSTPSPKPVIEPPINPSLIRRDESCWRLDDVFHRVRRCRSPAIEWSVFARGPHSPDADPETSTCPFRE